MSSTAMSSHYIPSPVQVCRFMQPDDANISGNVHGGTILKMIEEAGMIVTTRFCNQHANEKQSKEVVCALARVERTDFCQPMYVGEVAQLHGNITYCSNRSLEVQITVTAENILTNAKRMTNKATLWYVAVTVAGELVTVPQLQSVSEASEKAGQARYLKQKEERAKNNSHVDLNDDFSLPGFHSPQRAEPHTIAYAQSSLIHLVNVTDCAHHGSVSGGVTMKMMDEVAGICAARHCHTNVVTASMDATNFHKPITKGCVMHLKSRPTFTSNKSLEIEVVVDVEKVRSVAGVTELSWYRACSAFFTYVSLGPDKKPMPIPPLIRKTPAEEERFMDGEMRYSSRKKLRVNP